MEKIEFTRFIERYLEGKMQPAEKSWFEKELDGNLWLRKELELRQKTDKIVANSSAMDFRKKLMEAEQRHRSSGSVARVFGTVPAQYAAFFIGILLISSMFLLVPRNLNSGKLATKEIASYEPGTSSRAFGTMEEMNYNMAVEYYNQGDYQNAIQYLEKLVDNNDGNTIKSNFMLGVTNMKIEKYNDAIVPLEKVVNHNDNLFLEQAKWFLSVCYLNVDNTSDARDLLQNIADSESIYKNKAKRALKKLK